MAAHSCIMCRDYTAIDRFASSLGLRNIRSSGGQAANQLFADEKSAVIKSLDAINDKVRVSKLEDLRAAVKKLQESPILTNPKASDKERQALNAEFSAKEAEVKKLETEDNEISGLFAVKLFDLAIANLLMDVDDHVGRARLFCVWIAASITYEYSQGRISSAGVTAGDAIRGGKEFCAGYARLFVSMFNAVTIYASGRIGVKPDFFARTCQGSCKFISTAATPTQKPNGTFGHAWAIFPSSADAAGNATAWKVVDPCWIQIPGDYTKFTSQWFYNSNETMLRTHWAIGSLDRTPPNARPFTEDQFNMNDFAPFTDYSLDLQIEESSLQPRNYKLTAAQQQNFQFSRLCIGARAFPATLWLVPFKDGQGYNDLAVPFNPVAGQNPAIDYTAVLDTSAASQRFGGSEFEVHIAIPFSTMAGAAVIVANTATLRAMNSITIHWKDVVTYRVTAAHPLAI